MIKISQWFVLLVISFVQVVIAQEQGLVFRFSADPMVFGAESAADLVASTNGIKLISRP